MESYEDMNEEQKICFDAYNGSPPQNCSASKIPDEHACERCPARICNKNSWCPLP